MNSRKGLPFFPDASHDGQSARLWGIYPQRQEGLYMQRAKAPAGRLSPAQLRALAEVARKLTPGYPLHLTTRQDIEFHGVLPENLRRVQKKITAAGLVCTGACGDSVRNMTVCPGAGICPNSKDVALVADRVREELESLPFIQNLPRKFKISFSACEQACGLPWVNDLGFVLRADGTYLLVGAGSLGAPPRTGMVLSENLLGSEVSAAAAAATLLFNRLGDRKRRHKARLRHVRERLGDAAFLEQYQEEFRRAIARNADTRPASPLERNGFSQIVRLRFPQGDISPRQAMLLADVAEQADGQLRIDLEHGAWLVAKKRLHLSQELVPLLSQPNDRIEFDLPDRANIHPSGGAEFLGITHPSGRAEFIRPDCANSPSGGRAEFIRPTAALPNVISCPGAALCARAMTDCREVAARVREKMAGSGAGRALSCINSRYIFPGSNPPHSPFAKGEVGISFAQGEGGLFLTAKCDANFRNQALAVKISGCPSSCSHAAAADIGLIGRTRMLRGAPRECYKLVAGGGGGKTEELAIALASAIPAAHVPHVVDWLIAEYLAYQQVDGARFRDFILHEHQRLREHLLQYDSSAASLEHILENRKQEDELQIHRAENGKSQ